MNVLAAWARLASRADAKPRVLTEFIYPPIPIRSHDWCAWRDGHEEDGNYGWGRTEDEAIADLLQNEEMDE